MKIRKAKLSDAKKINDLVLNNMLDEFKLQFPKKSEKDLREEIEKSRKDRLNNTKKAIKSNSNYVMVMEDSGKIMGAGQCAIQDYNKNYGVMHFLYINKNYRKKGIGLKMMKEMFNWLKTKKVKKVLSNYFNKNIPSKNLHQKLNFKPISVVAELKF